MIYGNIFIQLKGGLGMDSPYRTLGVNQTMSLEEIKAVYRKLCKQNHPDVGGSTARFQEILNAWGYLEKNHVQVKPKKSKGVYHTSLFSLKYY